MRVILLTIVLLTGFSLCAQTPQSETQTLSTLLTEVQRLRLAIERNTLLGARTQIAILQLQTQQAHTDKLSKDLEEARKEVSRLENERRATNLVLKGMEARLSPADSPLERLDLERRIKTAEQPSASESQARVRESEISSQLQSDQSRLGQLQNQIADMERALDVAIRQVTGQ